MTEHDPPKDGDAEMSEEAAGEAPAPPADRAVPGEREIDPVEFERAVRMLETAVDDMLLLARVPDDLRVRLMVACGKLARPDRRERKLFTKERARLRREARRERDAQLLERTAIRRQRIDLVFPTPDPDRPGDSSAFLEGPSGAEATPQPESPRDSGSADDGEDRAPEAELLIEPRTCYICKADFRRLHHHYDAMCEACAEFNWTKRCQSADLSGRVALLTGGRVKIGYQAGIKLLRAGARVIVTTRFPRDAASRYAIEADFEQWQDRLEIYGLDLRHTPSIEAFISHVRERYERLDFIINNACQTVRRPPGFYAHLMAGEELPYRELPAATRRLLVGHECLREALERFPADGQPARLRRDTDDDPGTAAGADEPAEAAGRGDAAVSPAASGADDGESLAGLRHSAALSQVPLVRGDTDVGEQLFPSGTLDADLQQVDLRDINSWRLPLAQVPTVELLEVHLVNAVAPFVLNARLKELMLRTPERDKHIVNVSAMEGQFYRVYKTDKHPHTNMAKASLNMMTRTSAPDYHADGIHMNSVDTGWITDEDPVHITIAKQKEHGFHPPLDHVDAAARILAPIFDGLLTGEHVWGQFLKDYRPTRW